MYSKSNDLNEVLGDVLIAFLVTSLAVQRGSQWRF